MMDLGGRIEALSLLGDSLREDLEKLESGEETPLEEAIDRARQENGWFTPQFVVHALSHWAALLQRDRLEAWVSGYEFANGAPSKTVALILAGNIPLVGFHDVVSTFLSGHSALIKPSSQDRVLTAEMTERLRSVAGLPEGHLRIAREPLKDFHAVIATGSGNTARYFHSYFEGYPSVIRRNRTSVAVLSGEEGDDELERLMDDVFLYYGLGCRNVTKLYVPEGFDIQRLFQASLGYSDLLENNKYHNNFLYRQTLLTMQKAEVLENGLFILHRSEALYSPVSVLNYERYPGIEALNARITAHLDEIQCVVGRENTAFGQAQTPSLDNYADGVDTLDFLLSLAR